jgi:sterol 14-demethylase
MQVQDFVERAFEKTQQVANLFRKRETPAGLKLPPQLGGGLPIMGHSVEFITGTIALLQRAHNELGEVAAFNVFNRKMVAVFGPDAQEAVFRAPDQQLSPSEAYKIMTPVFGKGIVYDATPDVMAEQLKMLLPALKDKRMRTYGEAVIHEVEESTKTWGDAGTLDFVDFCRVLTNFTSSRCLLGKEFREGMTEEFAAVYHDLERGVTPLAYINAHLPIPSFRKRDKARVRLVEMITGIIGDRRRDKRTGEDFLQTLMESHYQDGRGLTEDEITGMLLAGMFAGHHTSSVTTAWTMIELLRTPAFLKRCVAEVDRVFGNGEPVSHGKLRELTDIENAVKESLRMHPPLFVLVRVAKADFIYKDYFIAKGSWVLVSPTVAHRMPDVFKDPDAFDPDRFAPPRLEDKRDFAYIAFGGGRHKCLGNAFAILQIKAIMAMLLGQYEFELGGDAIDSDFHGLVVGPKEPCRVHYRKRAQPSITTTAAAELEKISKADPESAVGCPVPHDGAAKPAGACPVAHVAPEQTEKTPVTLHVVLDRDLCQGHAVCVGEAPEVFRLDGKDRVEAILTDIPEALHDRVRAAARHCPTRAIKLT